MGGGTSAAIPISEKWVYRYPIADMSAYGADVTAVGGFLALGP
jgi:hypothetical protein